MTEAGIQEGQCWNRIGIYGSRACSRLTEVIHCRSCDVYQVAGRALFDRPPGEDSIDRWTEQLSAVPDDDAAERTPLVVFRLGAEWFALPAEWVREGAAPGPWRRVPHRSGTEFLGIMNVRGELIPYFSLAAVLGIESEADSAAERVLVCGGEGHRLVFPVGAILGLRRLVLDETSRPPATVGKAADAYTRWLVRHAVGSIAVLDAERLSGALEALLR
ncbi:CheW-like domain protein [Methylococcus capsulatus str. Bath]|jgi:chemotaxis signal transduction protein|uniref:CheW-like domain protein n=1 Tax=Methylococcus capsulatus (strain ATCC 33009 / NCIMB 11132 / Bath) TaxID=243233 RepID=Q60AL9_METCA|nr:chemotaxis protein CheW [Methylococcus capsulatus]AAU93088.1 CheW-like domain protein [Methylococcus capsulatus str. Bath]